MRRAALAGLLLAGLFLAACGPEGPVPPQPPAASFREAGAPIGSTTRGGPGDMAGAWVVAAAYSGAPFAAPGTRVGILAAPGGGTLWTFDGGTAVATAVTAPGRYQGAEAAFWVLWVDDDFRTAAVGTPDGSFGWIMDRPGEASPDRAAAAREMLDFNGYDPARLAGS